MGGDFVGIVKIFLKIKLSERWFIVKMLLIKGIKICCGVSQ